MKKSTYKNKEKYLVVDNKDPLGIAVEWTKLDSATFDSIPPNRLYNEYSISSSTGDLIQKTFIYLKKIENFNYNDEVFEEEEILIGISK